MAVSGSHTFSMVATGGEHTCGVQTTSGAAMCWGECGAVAHALVMSRGCGGAWLRVCGWQCELLPRVLGATQ